MRVGFVGLGVMGAPMARNVRKRFDCVTVYDIDAGRMAAFADGSFNTSGDVAGVAKQSDVVILSLPGSAVVERVLLGPDGIAPNAAGGSVVIDTSTTEPTVSRRVAEKLASHGIGFLDAPVSGGEKAAIDGSLSFMVGGDRQVFDRCLPVFESMGTSIVRIGESGMGEVAKLVNNLIVGATFAVVAEGFALAVKNGLDPAVLYEAIRGGWAQSKVLDLSAEAYLNRNFQPGGTVDIHWKDLGYALSLAKDSDVPTPITAIAHEVFKASRSSGDGSLAQPAVVMLWERLLGIRIEGKDND